MKKMFIIGVKDLKLVFRDRGALILMLLAPFLLTLGLGAVTGRFSGSAANGVSHIPVLLVNQDGQQLGEALVNVLHSPDLADLIDLTLSTDPAAAFKQVDDNQAAAAVVIPAGFTDSVISPQGQAEPAHPVQIELYANPTTPTSVGVVKTILDQFISRVEVGRVGGQVAVAQLVGSGRIKPQAAQAVGQAIGSTQADSASQSTALTLNTSTPNGQTLPFDVLAMLAPGMALMFLMYTASNGGRTILAERLQGTLPRLLVSPTTAVEVLGGKTFGIFLSGVAQMLVLIISTSLLFSLRWGDQTAVLALVLAAVFAAVGWGLVIAAMARTPNQVSMMGTAVMLTFGILGGTFINMNTMPQWFQLVSKITPNAWGLDGFTTLAQGGTLSNVQTPILALLGMGLGLFVIAVVLFNRRGLTEK